MTSSLASRPTLAIAAVTCGLAWAASAPLQLTHDFTDATAASGTAGQVILVLMAVALVAQAVASVHLGRLAAAPRAGLVAAFGCALIAVGATSSAINGGADLSWFPAVAGPGNLLWLGGTTWLAIALRRVRVLPLGLCVALPLLQVANLPLAFVGGNALALAWLLVARKRAAVVGPLAAGAAQVPGVARR